MPDIKHSLIIKASTEQVFDSISTPAGMDEWWTKKSTGIPGLGEVYQLYFGPDFDWRATVVKCKANVDFELKMDEAYEFWTGTNVGFHLEEKEDIRLLDFYHTGWVVEVDNFRESSYCWAMYLRILKRYLEFGESVAYENRLYV
jgi:uncharacterized protein YndB with AHSA1/START domain